MSGLRHLVLVLGDQLSHDSPALDGIDPAGDRVLMIEARGEATHVWSHKARIALFLSAMRHFAAELHASLSTHSPSGSISPDSSAIGMKTTGAIIPSRGCCQRTRASTPAISPVPAA